MSRITLLLTYILVGCAPKSSAIPTAPPPQPIRAVVHSSTNEGPSTPTLSGPVERPEWREHFRAERVTGTIALYDSADGRLSCSDVALCGKATSPASTFKIANSMIALETGVVEDTESVLPWDGKTYAVEAWNRELTLRSAVRFSCVPCFQAIAVKVGNRQMKDWVAKLDYGNHDITGGINQFWLNGALRISPLQQVDFLRRFDAGQLPISKRTTDSVRDMIALDMEPSHLLLGKTGLVRPPEFHEIAAWFVGWLELRERRVYFATLINGYERGVDVQAARRQVTERVLRALALLPEDAARAP